MCKGIIALTGATKQAELKLITSLYDVKGNKCFASCADVDYLKTEGWL